jgi:hypothetical protein
MIGIFLWEFVHQQCNQLLGGCQFHGVLPYKLTNLIYLKKKIVINALRFLLFWPQHQRRFQLECVVTDEDVTSFLLVEKAAENFFGWSAHHYVYNKKFSNPFVIKSPMIAASLVKASSFSLDLVLPRLVEIDAT